MNGQKLRVTVETILLTGVIITLNFGSLVFLITREMQSVLTDNDFNYLFDLFLLQGYGCLERSKDLKEV